MQTDERKERNGPVAAPGRGRGRTLCISHRRCVAVLAAAGTSPQTRRAQQTRSPDKTSTNEPQPQASNAALIRIYWEVAKTEPYSEVPKSWRKNVVCDGTRNGSTVHFSRVNHCTLARFSRGAVYQASEYNGIFVIGIGHRIALACDIYT